MSSVTNVYYIPSLLGAFTVEDPATAYPVGSFVHTLGFSAAGDGGAAMYKVVSGAPSGAKSYTVANTSFNYADGKFYVSSSSVFQLIPQHGKVYAEQFGVLPGGVAFAEGNIKMLSRAIAFAAQNGFVLTFVSGGVYYLNPGSISVPSGMHIDGNGATLQICDTDHAEVNLFNSSSLVSDVSIRNITLIGRRKSAKSGYTDQAIHINCSNLTVQNVRFKHFEYAFHTYGGNSIDTYEVQGDGESESKTYVINDIPNKNWLIDSCKTESCVFGIVTSEIDGLVIKDSDISCYTTSNDTAHCVYLSLNCLNVRVAGCSLREVSGDAIHKSYPYSSILDSSKNHFYTDLSINNADSALDIGTISQNVMCDNVFATEVAIALELSGADNCIVSNSYFSQTRTKGDTKAFICAANACNCWMQNSYAYYKGKHRVTSIYYPSSYVYDMFADKKHRRMYIGSDFKVPNHCLKFTGCEFFSTYVLADRYFYERYNSVVDSELQKNPTLSQYGEYWDNCSLFVATKQEVFGLNCINDLPGGITIRNSYLENIELVDRDQLAPFTIGCKRENRDSNYCKNVCPVYPDSCILSAFGKIYPWIRFENNFYAFNFSLNWACNDWSQYIIPISAVSVEQFVKSTGSYSSDCYKIDDKGKYLSMVDIM